MREIAADLDPRDAPTGFRLIEADHESSPSHRVASFLEIRETNGFGHRISASDSPANPVGDFQDSLVRVDTEAAFAETVR